MITSDGSVWKVDGITGAVNPGDIPQSLVGAHSYHNHPDIATHFSFSGFDAGEFIDNEEAFAKASDYLYEYTMERTDKTVEMTRDEVISRFEEIRTNEVREMLWHHRIDPDIDEYHATMEILAKELGIKYGRNYRQE